MSESNSDAHERDDNETRAFLEFQRLWENDEAPNVAEFCERHPDVDAGSLRLRIEDWLFVRQGLLGVDALQVSSPREEEEVPESIGPFQIIGLLGSGGMGRVYLAQQETPFKRLCALKVIGSEADSEQVLRRFGSEQQALAKMEHSNIARVFGAGETNDELPYFVMEYVDGCALTEFCDSESLSIEERLQIFSDLCSGVQHAHDKGIIHRDLKPNNVLVAVEDGRPVPKIIDFGLARAVEPTGDGETLLTMLGQVLGTPEYMSPEQVRGDELDVRTDVYALGVILYELLSGSLPLESSELRSMSLYEMQRAICEQEPQRPSARASQLAETEPSSAHRPNSRRWIARVRGDLDWIVLIAMHKNPERRYASPRELAADIDRFLRHEPILAHGPTRLQRLGKFVRRHRTGTILTASLLLSALGAVLVALDAFGRGQRVQGQLDTAVGLIREGQIQEAEDLLGSIDETDLESSQGATSLLARISLLFHTYRPRAALNHLRQARRYWRGADSFPEGVFPAWAAHTQLGADPGSSLNTWLRQVGSSGGNRAADLRAAELARALSPRVSFEVPSPWPSSGNGLFVTLRTASGQSLLYIAESNERRGLRVIDFGKRSSREVAFAFGQPTAVAVVGGQTQQGQWQILATYAAEGQDKQFQVGLFSLDVSRRSVTRLGKGACDLSNFMARYGTRYPDGILWWRRSPRRVSLIVQYSNSHSYHVADLDTGSISSPPSNLVRMTLGGWRGWMALGNLTGHETLSRPEILISSGEWTQYSIRVLRPREVGHDFEVLSHQVVGKSMLGCLIPSLCERSKAEVRQDVLFAKDSFWDEYLGSQDVFGRFRSIGIHNALRLARWDYTTCELRCVAEAPLGRSIGSWITPIAVASANLDGIEPLEILQVSSTHRRGRSTDARPEDEETTLQVMACHETTRRLTPELVVSCNAAFMKVQNLDADNLDELVVFSNPTESGSCEVTVYGLDVE